MRQLAFVLLLGGYSVCGAADPALIQVKAVYLMPMGNGLDQYLATQLTQDRVFDVVTDPSLADAVFTDRIGPLFEQAFAELYPPPPPPPEPAEAKQEKSAEKSASAESTTIGAAMADRPDAPPRVSSFSRGRGNVFLIDRRTKRILWSDYRRPRSSRPDELHSTADKLINQLESDLVSLGKPQR